MSENLCAAGYPLPKTTNDACDTCGARKGDACGRYVTALQSKIARLESELAEARKVPVEPTDAMCDAGFRALRERGAEFFDSDDMRYAYAFMLEAAPQPPAVAREDV